MDVKTFASFENNFILAFILFNSEYKNDLIKVSDNTFKSSTLTGWQEI